MYCKYLFLFITLFILSGITIGQCEIEKARLDTIQNKYAGYFQSLEKWSDEITRNLPDSVPDGAVGKIKFEVVMKRSHFSMDMVSVTMKDKKISLKLPQVTMKEKSFTSKACKVTWKNKRLCCGIKTKVPVVTCWDKKIGFKIPEFKIGITDIVMKIPEFRKNRVDFSFDVPQVLYKDPLDDEKYRNIQQQADAIAIQADSLSKHSAQLEEAQKEEVRQTMDRIFACMLSELGNQRAVAVKEFERALGQINQNIQDLTQKGIDPSNVQSDDGTVTDLYVLRNKLLEDEKNTLTEIDAAIQEIETRRTEAMANASTE